MNNFNSSSPNAAQRTILRLAWCVALIIILVQGIGFLAWAQESGGGDQPEFIRDAEIENYLHALAAPIYRAADIDPDSITIVIVKSNVINAFAGGNPPTGMGDNGPANAAQLYFPRATTIATANKSLPLKLSQLEALHASSVDDSLRHPRSL